MTYVNIELILVTRTNDDDDGGDGIFTADFDKRDGDEYCRCFVKSLILALK